MDAAPTRSADVPPLRFLHAAPGGPAAAGARRVPADAVTALGRACLADTGRLWSAVVEPAPRWTQEFERDVLGVMAAPVLRSADFTLGRIAEEMTARAGREVAAVSRGAPGSSVFDGASAVAQEWYQLGVPLGWWDTGRGPADRRPNVFGAAAAVAVFRSATGLGRQPARGEREHALVARADEPDEQVEQLGVGAHDHPRLVRPARRPG